MFRTGCRLGFRAAIVLAGSMALAPSVHAQRTAENVTAESDDAFGRSVGNERIGIYNPNEVRGFSPITAGNVRIEGLYFDRQTDPTQRVVQGSAIRVGIAAQSYPFPSPTGIVDFELRSVGEKRIISPVVYYGPYGSMGVEVDAQVPLVKDTLGVAIGAAGYRDSFSWGATNKANTLAIVPRWRPAENIELRPFFSRIMFRDEEAEPRMLTRGGVLPPKIERDHYYGQPWADNEGKSFTYGLLGDARFGAWTTRLGLFESSYRPRYEVADLYEDIDASGRALEKLVVFPDSRFASKSGELRLSRTFDESERRHILLFTARGRIQQRRYGGEQEVQVGDVQLGVGRVIPRPDLTFGEQSHDEVRQRTFGAGYELRWKDRGELSLGLQKTNYTKEGDTPEGPLPTTRADPLLKNITATVYATKELAVYASYTQGLEESPVAPSNALNRNVAAPALLTKQYDAGIRLAVLGEMKLIAGLFEVEKPYFDLDAAGLFRSLGTVKHRGVELSLSGSPVENLTLVAGTRYLDATVSGPIVDAGLIGRRPVGAARLYSIASIDYALPDTGFSFDATAEQISRQVATTENTVEVPGRAVLHLGSRYRFKLVGKPATLRAQIGNVFDRYGWSVISGGAYVYNEPRRFSLLLATDL